MIAHKNRLNEASPMITHMSILYEARCITIILLMLTVSASNYRYVELNTHGLKRVRTFDVRLYNGPMMNLRMSMGIKQSLICCTDIGE